jgi:hypothetical protein
VRTFRAAFVRNRNCFGAIHARRIGPDCDYTVSTTSWFVQIIKRCPDLRAVRARIIAYHPNKAFACVPRQGADPSDNREMAISLRGTSATLWALRILMGQTLSSAR